MCGQHAGLLQIERLDDDLAQQTGAAQVVAQPSQRVAAPENLASHMFALLPQRPEFSATTTDLRVLDSTA